MPLEPIDRNFSECVMDTRTGVRVLFAGQYWPGANSKYIADAFSRCGAIVRWLNDTNYFPGWRTKVGRGLRHLAKPLIDWEWNRQLLLDVESFQPDLVYVTQAQFISPETIDRIHRLSIPVMCFYHDVPWNKRPGFRFSESIDRFDLIATTRHWHRQEFLNAGAKAVQVVRFGFEPSVHRPVHLSQSMYRQYGSDLVFIGTLGGRRSTDLAELLKSDWAKRINFKIWGHSWDEIGGESSLLQYWQKRGIYEQEIAVIYASSKIALHWVRWEPQGSDKALQKGDQHNSRTFQIAACGGAIMVAQRTDEHSRFFEEDKEAVFFDTVDELRKKLTYWLNPAQDSARQAMAVAARNRCLREDYSYKPVVRQFLEYFNLSSI